jgi:hypothetical protein
MRLHDEPGAFVWPAARGRSFDYCRYPDYCDGLVPDRNFQLCRSWRTEFRSQAEATGDEETMRRAASVALDLASRGPRLPRHPDVGLVQTDEATLRRLKNIARANG